MKKRILIAGVNGFIGTYLYKILERDYDIIPLSKSINNDKEFFTSIDLSRKEDIDLISKNSPEFDIVIFLVGLAHKKGKGKGSCLNYRKGRGQVKGKKGDLDFRARAGKEKEKATVFFADCLGTWHETVQMENTQWI